VIEQAAVRSREYAHTARIKGEEPSMYEELVLVRGIVDPPAHDALDEVENFLTGQGYTTVWRASDSLTVQRHRTGNAERYAPNLTVKALHQPDGGL